MALWLGWKPLGTAQLVFLGVNSLSPPSKVTILGTVSGLGYALVALVWRVPMDQPAPVRAHSYIATIQDSPGARA